MIKKMSKLYCVICGKYGKFEKPKISYLLEKTLALPIICRSARTKMKNYLRRRIN